MAGLRKIRMSGNDMVPWHVLAVSWLFLLLPTLFVTDSGAPRLFSGAALAAAAETPSKGKQLLDDLVRRARQEGALNATIYIPFRGKIEAQLVEAFQKRFGLQIKVTTAAGASAQEYPKAIAETKAGAPSAYDTLWGTATDNMVLVGAGGTQRVENWEGLLAEINPMVGSRKIRPEQISPRPLQGHGFLGWSRPKALVYNRSVISKDDLPKTHSDLGHPKYKGKLTQPAWPDSWDIAPAVFEPFDKEKWLQIIRKTAENTYSVEFEIPGTQRVVLGEVGLAFDNAGHALSLLHKDPQLPIVIAYFQDYNPIIDFLYVVRKGARHPAAATLFAMWTTTPEAATIWQTADDFVTQLRLGDSALDRKVRETITRNRAPMIGFLDNEKTAKVLEWYSTEEGTKFRRAIADAIRGK